MMHDPEQSEPLIVAMKSSNKAEGTAAEAMEPSGGAKRNALQATTHQTLSWESAPGGPSNAIPSATAFLDRLMHHSHLLELRGKSYRLHQSSVTARQRKATDSK